MIDFAALNNWGKSVKGKSSELEKNDDALGVHAYCASESHLNGYRLIIGFDTLEQVQAAHQAIVDAGKRRWPALWAQANERSQSAKAGDA